MTRIRLTPVILADSPETVKGRVRANCPEKELRASLASQADIIHGSRGGGEVQVGASGEGEPGIREHAGICEAFGADFRRTSGTGQVDVGDRGRGATDEDGTRLVLAKLAPAKLSVDARRMISARVMVAIVVEPAGIVKSMIRVKLPNGMLESPES